MPPKRTTPPSLSRLLAGLCSTRTISSSDSEVRQTPAIHRSNRGGIGCWRIAAALLLIACGSASLNPVALAQNLVLGWHTNLEEACELSARNGKPLFIVFRCVRCPECLAWDGQVAQEDAEIAKLREQFVCARITSMNRVNLRRFDFDYDATWTAFFTDSQLNIYSRYGGRDQGDPEARLSKASLLHTMREALAANELVRAARARGEEAVPDSEPVQESRRRRSSDLHFQTDPARTESQPMLFQPVPADVARPEDMPLLEKNNQGCVHCHLVREYSLLQAYHDGRFTRDLLFSFPLPESLGIQIDRQHGHRAAKVQAGSAAGSAGLQAGDELVQVDNVPIRSELDIRWALHRLPQNTTQVSIQFRRTPLSDPASGEQVKELSGPLAPASGKRVRERGPSVPVNLDAASASAAQLVKIDLTLPPRWRESELDWRKSSRSIPIDWSFRGAAMTASQRRESNLPAAGLAINILSVSPSGFAAAMNLEKYDVILGLNGGTRECSLEQLRSDMLRQISPGDEVRLTVRRSDKTLELKGRFPDWFTEKTSVP